MAGTARWLANRVTPGATTRRSDIIARASVPLLGAQGAGLMAALVANVLAARTLGPGGRGELALYFQVSFLAAMVMLEGHEKGLSVSSTRASFADNLRLLISSLYRNVILLGVITLAVTIASVTWLEGQTAIYVGVAVMAVATAAYRAYQSASVVAADTRPFLSGTIWTQGILLLCLFALVLLDVSAVSVWLLVYGAATLVPLGVFCLRRGLGGSLGGGSISAVEVAALRRAGVRLLPASLANLTMLRADRLVMPFLATTSALGTYVVAATLTEIIAWPAQAYSDIAVARWRLTEDPVTLCVRALVAVTAYSLGAFALVTFGGALLIIPLFGRAYAPAVGLVPVLAGAAAAYAIGRVAIAGCLSIGYSRSVSSIETIAMAIAIVIYVTAIPELGARGGAIGSLCGYGVSAVAASFLIALRARAARLARR